MGLSEESRLRGTYWSIQNISKKKSDYLESINGNKSKALNLINLIDQLWHAFLGKNCNTGLWCSGPSCENTVNWNTSTPWGIAINHYCHGLIHAEEDDIIPSKLSQLPFNAFDGFLGIEDLLYKADPLYAFVFYVYTQSEQLAYYVRRYDDNGMGLTSLNKLISDIQGECFNQFIDSMTGSIFARAYLLNLLCEKYVYGDIYPDQVEGKDVILDWIITTGIHHSISKVMELQENGNELLKSLAQWHKKLYKQNNSILPFDRLMLILDLCGSSFHSQNDFNNLLTLINQHKLCNGEEVSLLTEAFRVNTQKSIELKDTYKNNENPLSIYDYNFMYPAEDND